MRHHITSIALACAVALPVAVTTACGDDDGRGTVAVEIWGEAFIEEGIPAAEFEDGWSVTFDVFAVCVADVTAAGADLGGRWAVDVAQAGPHAVTTGDGDAGAIRPVAYSILPVDASTENVNVDTGLFDTMLTEGWSVYVEGAATRDGSTITFAWGFDVAVGYHDCQATESVPDGGTGPVQLTIHGDHLFYESLVDHDAGLRFGALAAADADGDGHLLPAELADFAGIDFQALDHYDVPAGSGIDNLWDYLAAQIATLGHIDGEGHCD